MHQIAIHTSQAHRQAILPPEGLSLRIDGQGGVAASAPPCVRIGGLLAPVQGVTLVASGEVLRAWSSLPLQTDAGGAPLLARGTRHGLPVRFLLGDAVIEVAQMEPSVPVVSPIELSGLPWEHPRWSDTLGSLTRWSRGTRDASRGIAGALAAWAGFDRVALLRRDAQGAWGFLATSVNRPADGVLFDTRPIDSLSLLAVSPCHWRAGRTAGLAAAWRGVGETAGVVIGVGSVRANGASEHAAEAIWLAAQAIGAVEHRTSRLATALHRRAVIRHAFAPFLRRWDAERRAG